MPAHPTINAEPTVFFDGELMPAAEVRLPVGEHGGTPGFGFYESFRTSGGRPHLWPYHARRLGQACATAHIWLPEWFLGRDEAWLRTVVGRLLEANHLTEAAFRYTVTAGANLGAGGGSALESLRPRPLPAPAPRDGITLRVLKTPRDNGEWLPRPKSLNCVNLLLARQELEGRAADPDDDGLLLAREAGHVVETTRRSLAWVRHGCWYYPDPALGSIAGTCLAWLIESCGRAEPCRATAEELADAEAIVALGAVSGIVPVRALCGREDEVLVGSFGSCTHPLVITMQQRWAQALAVTAAS